MKNNENLFFKSVKRLQKSDIEHCSTNCSSFIYQFSSTARVLKYVSGYFHFRQQIVSSTVAIKKYKFGIYFSSLTF